MVPESIRNIPQTNSTCHLPGISYAKISIRNSEQKIAVTDTILVRNYSCSAIKCCALFSFSMYIIYSIVDTGIPKLHNT